MIPSITYASNSLYLICFSLAFFLSAALTPVMRRLAIRWEILDRPLSEVKTHRQPVPYLGGMAVALALFISLGAARLLTQFPTGTLRSIRGIFFGALIMLLLGLVDDVKRKGLSYRFKFLVQFVAALGLIAFDMRIKFITPWWFADMLTVI